MKKTPPVRTGRRLFSTVYEMSAAVFMVVVLSKAVVPLACHAIRNHQLGDHAMQIYAAFNAARMEAIQRNASITVCATPDASAAVPKCSDSADDWSKGWVVYVANGKSAEREIIQRGTRSAPWMVTSATMGSAHLTFLPDGTLFAERRMTITLAALESGGPLREISISHLGHPNISERKL